MPLCVLQERGGQRAIEEILVNLTQDNQDLLEYKVRAEASHSLDGNLYHLST